jgi:glycosyltransferase involved in cell wall biosynthesis/tetratricopeptide (TPR) repeat protein
MADGLRPRALLLTPVIPSDRGNGLAMRAGVLLTGLAQAFAVNLAVTPCPPDPAGMAFAAASCERIDVLADAIPDPVADRVALLATPQARERAGLLRPLPELARGAQPRWAAQVSTLAADIDLVVVFRLYLAPLIDALLDARERPALLIDSDELDADRERSDSRPQQAAAFERLERYYLPRFDHVIACSASDARTLAARSGPAAATAIPNAVRLPERSTEPTGAIDLVFVGNLSYAPNIEAVHWLCEAVLPLLGEVSLAIVGSGPNDELRALERDRRVTVVADPEDVAPWYAQARVAVLPLLRGGGSRLKLIEALAHARPVVSTTVGAEGQPWGRTGATAGVVIADAPQAFAAACGELLDDRQRAQRLGERGREAVRTDAAVPVVAARVAAVAQEALLRHTARTTAARPVRPLLSAALIVRDEEAVLGPCLDSLHGVADEVVIVDTGSRDATVAIAREHGARVLHRPWEDDFAASRNHGLDHIRGDWVLYIDADERVAPIDRSELERRLSSSPATAMRILLRPTVHATPYYEYRLWRNDPRIRFTGVMHEQVVDAIHAAARQDARNVDDWPGLLLEHIGYEGDQTRKHTRNLPLLQAQLELDPSNIYNWRHLARVLDGLGRPEQAATALERATTLALAQGVPSVDGGLAWAELVRARHEQGDDVSELLELGRARWPQHWLICWIEGIIAEQQGRLDEAERCFRSLLAVDLGTLPRDGIAYDERIFREWAYASLGLVLFRAGRDSEAAAAYAQAERHAPQELEYRIKRGLAQARARRSGWVT